jgi:hypothetical protein
MTTSRVDGFSERPSEYAAATASVDFVQAERDRLRAGLLDQPPVTSSDDPRLVEALRLPSPASEEVSGRALGKFAELWRTRHQHVLAELPRGTGVVVDYASGLYLTAPKHVDALVIADGVFGPARPGWTFEHGIPLMLGGGLCALSSEA